LKPAQAGLFKYLEINLSLQNVICDAKIAALKILEYLQ
jgi:hypothetical protein